MKASIMIKPIALALFASLIAFSAAAEGPSCNASAAEKKLAGAAKNSFIKKCEKEAQASCEAQSGEKKLAGAAKNSFVKKCVKGAVG